MPPRAALGRHAPAGSIGKKEAPGVPGLEWEEKDSAKTKKAGNGAGLSASRPKTGLAVGARVTGWREQPSAAARLGAIDTISVRRLPVLGLLGLRLAVLLAVLRIRWSVRHISLGYDARKLGEEGVGRGGVTAISVSRTDAKTECCGCGKKHGPHGLSPDLPASLERVRGLFHRIVCDGGEMGFLPLRDNRASWHSIYAHSEAAFVTGVIDRRRQPAAALAEGCVPS
jgi:hypothetical protein